MTQNIEIAKRDKNSEAAEEKYFVLLRGLKIDRQGIFTVSKVPLIRGGWTVSSPTDEDIRQSSKIASSNLPKIQREKDESLGYSYKPVLGYGDKEIKEIASREKTETYTLKIKNQNTEIILLPTLYEVQTLGGDLISTVILRKDDKYRFLGHIRGCLLSVGADVDSDGFPEVITENCDSSESQQIQYQKIFPEIKYLIRYSHS
jgi:hypothetical protein